MKQCEVLKLVAITFSHIRHIIVITIKQRKSICASNVYQCQWEKQRRNYIWINLFELVGNNRSLVFQTNRSHVNCLIWSQAQTVSCAISEQSVLGIDAVMNQRNVVQVETLNFSNERVHLPILSLTLGRNDMVSCDIHNYCHSASSKMR